MTPIEDFEAAFAGEGVDDEMGVDSQRDEPTGAEAREDLDLDPAQVAEIEDTVRDALGLDSEEDMVGEDTVEDVNTVATVELPLTGVDTAEMLEGAAAIQAQAGEDLASHEAAKEAFDKAFGDDDVNTLLAA